MFVISVTGSPRAVVFDFPRSPRATRHLGESWRQTHRAVRTAHLPIKDIEYPGTLGTAPVISAGTFCRVVSHRSSRRPVKVETRALGGGVLSACQCANASLRRLHSVKLLPAPLTQRLQRFVDRNRVTPLAGNVLCPVKDVVVCPSGARCCWQSPTGVRGVVARRLAVGARGSGARSPWRADRGWQWRGPSASP